MAPIVTECDKRKEQITRERLAEFVERLGRNLRLIRNLISVERPNVDKIWASSIRYELLARSCPDAAPYLVDLTEEVKAECLRDFGRRLVDTGNLVSEVVDSYNRILASFQRFEQAAYRLDWTQQSELIKGSEHQEPLEVYLSRGHSICQQLEAMVVEFQNAFNQIDGVRSVTIERFRGCLKIPDEFDAFATTFLSSTEVFLE